jgi:hypothetical protein
MGMEFVITYLPYFAGPDRDYKWLCAENACDSLPLSQPVNGLTVVDFWGLTLRHQLCGISAFIWRIYGNEITPCDSSYAFISD